jgi:hypothetical protein
MDKLLGQIASALAKRVNGQQAALILVLIVVVAFALLLLNGLTGLKNIWLIAGLTAAVLLLAFWITILVARGRVAPDPGPVPESLAAGVPTTPTKAAPDITDDQRARIIQGLNSLVEQVAQLLAIPIARVQANVFGVVDKGFLGILPGLSVNMSGQELAIKIPVGYGCTGRAFQKGETVIGVKLKDGWRSLALSPVETNRLHPDLKWIISVPVRQPDDSAVRWVLSVDGLEPRDRAQLEVASKPVIEWGFALALD